MKPQPSGQLYKSYDIKDDLATLVGCAVYIVINIVITVKEIRRRRRGNITFNSRSLKWLSFLSIILGLVRPLFLALYHLNGFCHFSHNAFTLTGDIHPICVGLYQLSRLYQSFANRIVSRGYPQTLFVVMVIFAVVYLLFVTVLDIGMGYWVRCGIDSDFQVYETKIILLFDREQVGQSCHDQILLLIYSDLHHLKMFFS